MVMAVQTSAVLYWKPSPVDAAPPPRSATAEPRCGAIAGACGSVSMFTICMSPWGVDHLESAGDRMGWRWDSGREAESAEGTDGTESAVLTATNERVAASAATLRTLPTMAASGGAWLEGEQMASLGVASTLCLTLFLTKRRIDALSSRRARAAAE